MTTSIIILSGDEREVTRYIDWWRGDIDKFNKTTQHPLTFRAYNVNGTVTGRFHSDEPTIVNPPREDKVVEAIRDVGDTLVSVLGDIHVALEDLSNSANLIANKHGSY